LNVLYKFAKIKTILKMPQSLEKWRYLTIIIIRTDAVLLGCSIPPV